MRCRSVPAAGEEVFRASRVEVCGVVKLRVAQRADAEYGVWISRIRSCDKYNQISREFQTISVFGYAAVPARAEERKIPFPQKRK